MTTTDAIIAALVLPVPFFHLWLHALLPFWRRSPLALYVFGLALWIGAFKFLPAIALFSPAAFEPTPAIRYLGTALMIIGFLFAAWSLATLGPVRFFVWAVLRPLAAPRVRVSRGPFSFVPHPAYLGYVVVALGNLLHSGRLYLAGVLAILLFLTPLVIWLEEHELEERVELK